MSRRKQRGFISESDWNGMIFVILLAGVVLGAFIFEGIPFLWHLLRPWIHSVTG